MHYKHACHLNVKNEVVKKCVCIICQEKSRDGNRMFVCLTIVQLKISPFVSCWKVGVCLIDHAAIQDLNLKKKTALINHAASWQEEAVKSAVEL